MRLGEHQIDHLIEIIAAVMLALATIGSSWCAYQSTRWSGIQAIRFSEAYVARTQSLRQSNLADQLASIDVGMWLPYATALDQNNQRLADFIQARFRPELKVANDAWLAARPLQNPGAPSSPFLMSGYSLSARQEAQRLLQVADEKAQQAVDANERSTNYVLLTVVFAAVLFFGGVGTKLETRRLRILTILFGISVLVLAATALAIFSI